MKINELSKELHITNKDLINYLKSQGFKATSHLQSATGDMIESARRQFSGGASYKEEKIKKEPKRYTPDEMIPCRCIVPWKLSEVGLDKVTVYHWNGYDDVEEVSFRDLQSFKRKDILKKGKIAILDTELCKQWAKDLTEDYKLVARIKHPEKIFEKDDVQFRKDLRQGSGTFKEVIKYTAMELIRKEEYPSINKIKIIDEELNTCIKSFV